MENIESGKQVSIEEAKQLLGVDADRYTDEDLQDILQYLKAVANSVIRGYLESRAN